MIERRTFHAAHLPILREDSAECVPELECRVGTDRLDDPIVVRAYDFGGRFVVTVTRKGELFKQEPRGGYWRVFLGERAAIRLHVVTNRNEWDGEAIRLHIGYWGMTERLSPDTVRYVDADDDVTIGPTIAADSHAGVGMKDGKIYRHGRVVDG